MADILHKQINLRQVSANTYLASSHPDWALGKTLNGGCLAALIHHAAATHLVTDPALIARGQPDILSLHIEYLRVCEPCESTITIVPLKVGFTTSTLQLRLCQKNDDQVRIIALATTTNFDKSLGPSAPTDWALHPPPSPLPNFDRIEANKPDPNWVPATLVGEVFTFSHRLLYLYPRCGFPFPGICDAWNRFLGDERIDATYVGLLADVIPSMSDTLLRSGMYDAHALHDCMAKWAEENPGVPVRMTNSIAEVMRSTTFNNTVTLSLEFRKRIPEDGLRWVFTRTATKMMQHGRMGVDITMFDESMDLVCEAHQLILVLEAQRKFPKKKATSLL